MSYPAIRFDGSAGSNQELRDELVGYIGASAKKDAAGLWERPTGVRLANLEVPGEVLYVAGDSQLTSVVDWTIDGCYFHDWLDAYYEDSSYAGPNNHIECLQIGGCENLHIHNSRFVRSSTHALFCRAWSASSSLPPQTIQGLVLDRCVFEGSYSEAGTIPPGTADVNVMDDLVDLAFGPTDATIVGCAFAHTLALELRHGRAVIRGNKFASMTRHALNLWLEAGHDVGDNVYGEITGSPASSPFAGDVVDPAVDVSTPNYGYGWYTNREPEPEPGPDPHVCECCGQTLP